MLPSGSDVPWMDGRGSFPSLEGNFSVTEGMLCCNSVSECVQFTETFKDIKREVLEPFIRL